MEDFLLVPFLLLLAGGALKWVSWQARCILESWAAENNYRLLEINAPFLSQGPFAATSSSFQAVRRFAIEDEAGRKRSGWALCGSWMEGINSEQIKVRWDDE